MTGKLLLVDGSNLLFQMFYGMPARIVGKHGKPVHGTLGFVGALLKIIKKIQPTHIAVFFDGECENERKELDSDYKANRPDFALMLEEETPFCQLPDIYAALDYLKIRYAETKSCEADDILASYALRYEEAEVVISSFDSDFFQLISGRVSVLRYRGEQSILCTPAFVEEKFGVPPSQYADYKCLVGDNADNIKGVRGIGPKRAAELLRRFHTLDGIYQNLQEIERVNLREGLLAERERVEKNRLLIRLNGGQELPFSLQELAFGGSEVKTAEVMRAIGAL